MARDLVPSKALSVERCRLRLLDEVYQQPHDVEIKAYGASFPAQRLVLTAISGYFKARLGRDWQSGKKRPRPESDAHGAEPLEFTGGDDVVKPAFQFVLDFMHAKPGLELQADIVFDIISAAQFLQVDGLVPECASFLQENLTPASLPALFRWARDDASVEAEAALTRCLHALRYHLPKEESEWTQAALLLGRPAVEDLLCSSDLMVHGEQERFDLVVSLHRKLLAAEAGDDDGSGTSSTACEGGDAALARLLERAVEFAHFSSTQLLKAMAGGLLPPRVLHEAAWQRMLQNDALSAAPADSTTLAAPDGRPLLRPFFVAHEFDASFVKFSGASEFCFAGSRWAVFCKKGLTHIGVYLSRVPMSDSNTIVDKRTATTLSRVTFRVALQRPGSSSSGAWPRVYTSSLASDAFLCDASKGKGDREVVPLEDVIASDGGTFLVRTSLQLYVV